MKKRVVSLLLAATMVFGLTACGGSDAPAADSAPAEESTDAAADDAAADDTAGEETDAAAETATGEKILSVQVGPDPETMIRR